ncbi:hypothetical protein TcasGA2_TC012446 [Tribolium castaneum]|uniref:Uncharacterized protein n=1 Tax=Tribolium castaneum TaxID=7070 RepID=D6X2C3_TRICA|nr:hypothetical protein TcasGA2_TC012446 [Tribolium castaneum]
MALRAVRKNYYGQRIQNADNKSKCAWNIVNKICGRSKKCCEIQIEGDPKQIVNDINQYFINSAPFVRTLLAVAIFVTHYEFLMVKLCHAARNFFIKRYVKSQDTSTLTSAFINANETIATLPFIMGPVGNHPTWGKI